MATPGFAGKILLINLTTKQISALDSAKYEAYGGGHGTGTALFWDLCVAPGGWDLQDAFDPKNIVAFMTGPLAARASRLPEERASPGWPTDMAYQLVRSQQFRRQFRAHAQAGRMGWRGVQGSPILPSISTSFDDKVTIEDAKALWGLNVWETQEEMWKMESTKAPVRYGSEWQKLGRGIRLKGPPLSPSARQAKTNLV